MNKNRIALFLKKQCFQMSSSCGACRHEFNNGSRVAALLPSGLLVCEQCAGPTHPVTSEPCSVVMLKKGGTGFSANADETLLATKKREGFQLG
jgi:hypothetical protein